MPQEIPSSFPLDTYPKRYLRLSIRLFSPDASQGQAATRLPAVGQLSQPHLYEGRRGTSLDLSAGRRLRHIKKKLFEMAERDDIPLSELERYKSSAWE